VRQATKDGLTLGQLIKKRKLLLVDPSKKDMRRYSVAGVSAL
jgi:hypothetical protein